MGSDLIKNRPDWKVVDNPFAVGDPIVLLPAIRPDFTLFHAPYADRHGNVFIGRRREVMSMAHASVTTLVTVEEIRDVDLFDDEATAGSTLPASYIGGLAEAKRGAWPLNLWNIYGVDAEHIKAYCDMARSAEGFSAYLDAYVDIRQAAE